MEVVNNPQAPTPQDNPGNGLSFLLGVILVIVVLFLLFYYGLPALRSVGSTQPNQPAENSTNIDIPDEVDININDDRNE